LRNCLACSMDGTIILNGFKMLHLPVKVLTPTRA
jgi:hypothetical protein